MKKLQAGLVLSIIFLGVNALGQSTELEKEKPQVRKNTTQTFLDPILNLVSSNLNYGSSNAAVADYKKSVRGIQVGLSFQAGITPGLSLVSEFYFMMNGGKLKANNPLTINETTLRFYSLELPLLMRVHLNKFYLNAGPSLGYNLSGTKKIEEQSKALSFNNSSEGFKRFDAGVQVGGGYMFPWKTKRIALDLRYNYGLTNVSNDKEIYNRSFIVSVHFSKAWKINPLGRNKTF